MPYTVGHRTKINAPSFVQLYQPIKKAGIGMPPLEAQGNRPLKMTFEDHLKSLIDAVFSMHWADYRKGAKKAKVHLGFDLNHGIPRKIFLSDQNSE